MFLEAIRPRGRRGRSRRSPHEARRGDPGGRGRRGRAADAASPGGGTVSLRGCQVGQVSDSVQPRADGFRLGNCEIKKSLHEECRFC